MKRSALDNDHNKFPRPRFLKSRRSIIRYALILRCESEPLPLGVLVLQRSASTTSKGSQRIQDS